MQLEERLLYHQIHPLKLLTDVSTAVAAAALFWGHRPVMAFAIGLLPSAAMTVALIQFADLERYRSSPFGRYVHRFMTRTVEVARLAGLLPFWGGAWLHRPTVMGIGVGWILGCWLLGLRAEPNG
jgi:hypothetical protein